MESNADLSSTETGNGSSRLALPLLVVACAVLITFGFMGLGGGETPDLSGSWELVNINGRPIQLDSGFGKKPWVDFESDGFSGDDGDNTFGGRYSIDGTTMYTHEVFITLSDCAGCHNTAANAASVNGFFSHEGGFEVTVRGDRLIWSRPGTELEFVALDERRDIYDG